MKDNNTAKPEPPPTFNSVYLADTPEHYPDSTSCETDSDTMEKRKSTTTTTTTTTGTSTSREFSSRRFILLALLFATAVTAAIAVAMVVAVETDSSTERQVENRQAVQALLAGTAAMLLLQDPFSPYARALDWITFYDPLQLTANHAQFEQRYLAAYLYFATTLTQPWAYCNPPNATSSSSCAYQGIRHGHPVERLAHRWLSAETECVWAGLHCNAQGVIHQIEISTCLSSNTNTHHPSLFCLALLQKSPHIISAFFVRPHAMCLFVAHANMTGTFPEGILHLSMLESLSLEGNELIGPLPTQALTELQNLVELHLADNQFMGPIPQEWYHRNNTSKLEIMDLAANRITGSISSEIQNLSNLVRLKLADNLLKGPIPTELGQLERLYGIYLGRNLLTGTIPTELGRLRALEYLFVNENDLSGSIPTQAPEILVSLRVYQNAKLGGELPHQIFPRLIRLDAYGCNFTQNLTTFFASDVFTQNLTSFWERTFPHVGIGRLSMLRLDHNNFFGRLPENFGQLFPSLTDLTLAGNDLTGSIPESVCKLRSSQHGLSELVADCATPSSNISAGPEIYCPDDCCTVCCDKSGENCSPTN